MKFRNFKKKLKCSELIAHFYNKDAITYFHPLNREKGNFLIIGVDYDGEAWDCYISNKDLKKYVKQYKFREFGY